MRTPNTEQQIATLVEQPKPNHWTWEHSIRRVLKDLHWLPVRQYVDFKL